jgi:hypothetical protein
MPIADDIAAIRADPTKTETDVNRLKCQAMHDALLPFVKQTYRFNGVDYTLWEVWLEDGVLCLTLKAVNATGGAVRIRPQRVYRFLNPPPLAADRSDNRVQAGKEMLAGLL